MYDEEDFLMLSGIQHFAYCRRQWALIHIEQQWAENGRTAEGQIFHSTAHDASKTEKRGDKITTRGLRIKSRRLGITGICDVVEFHRSDQGVSMFHFEGLWLPYPVEYKTGEPKEHDADLLQLCAQAMCLEEMLLCTIEKGSLFYGKTRRRFDVDFTSELRNQVSQYTEEMHYYFQRGYTPKVKAHKGCNACSLKEMCVPKLNRSPSVASYIEETISRGIV